MRFTSLVAAVALAAPLAFAAGAQEVGAALRHADGGYLPNAAGNVGIRNGSDFQRFTVTVTGAGDGVTLTVQLGTGGDQFTSVGTLSASTTGLIFNVTTQNGGQLPLGATLASQLSGDAVRVIDGEGHAILLGTVPAFPSGDAGGGTTTGGGDSGGTTGGGTTLDGGGSTTAAPLTARADLVRPDGSSDADASGVVAVTQRDGSADFRCETAHLDANTNYILYVGDHATATASGDFTTNGEGGGVMDRDTATGASLPGGVGSLADLAGKHVEIRDRAGDVVLVGAIPSIATPSDVAPVHTDSTQRDADSGAAVHVVVDIRPRRGHQTFRVNMAHLPRHDLVVLAGGAKSARARLTADVYMDDGTGTFQPIGSARIDVGGRAHLRFTTVHGGTLPLGAATLRDLAGRAVQVRVEGLTFVSGSVPNF